jgi:putative hydrolase of the HAD superfamily
MIELIGRLKAQHGLKIVVVSNESREVNAYRIHAFKLDQLADAFISSCFVHMRKPDVRIFQLALDLAQASPAQIVYIDNTPMFVEIADGLGIRSILHQELRSTRATLSSFGLHVDDASIPPLATEQKGDSPCQPTYSSRICSMRPPKS